MNESQDHHTKTCKELKPCPRYKYVFVSSAYRSKQAPNSCQYYGLSCSYSANRLTRLSQATNNAEEQSVENDIFYFGGPLFGINNPTLPCNSEVLTNSDGTRVAFCVDPGPPATRAPVGPVERGPVERESEDLFTTTDLGDGFGDAENFFENAQTVFQYAENGLNEDLELSSVSTSSLHHNNHNSAPPLTSTRSQKIATWPTWRKIETSSYWQMRPWVPIRKRGRSQLMQQHRATCPATRSSKLTQHQLTTHRTTMSSGLKYQPDSTLSTAEQ